MRRPLATLSIVPLAREVTPMHTIYGCCNNLPCWGTALCSAQDIAYPNALILQLLSIDACEPLLGRTSTQSCGRCRVKVEILTKCDRRLFRGYNTHRDKVNSTLFSGGRGEKSLSKTTVGHGKTVTPIKREKIIKIIIANGMCLTCGCLNFLIWESSVQIL